MYEAWESAEQGARAVAKRRRSVRNSRTYWAVFGSIALAWLVTSFGAAASVEEARRTDALNYMASASLVLFVAGVLTHVAVAAGRATSAWAEGFIRRHRRAGEQLPRWLHRVLVAGVIGMLAASSGAGVGQVSRVLGGDWLLHSLATAILVLVPTSIIALVLGDADLRREASTEQVDEELAVRTLASMSAGELAILERLEGLAGRLESAVTKSDADVRPQAFFDSWSAWWSARPRAAMFVRKSDDGLRE